MTIRCRVDPNFRFLGDLEPATESLTPVPRVAPRAYVVYRVDEAEVFNSAMFD